MNKYTAYILYLLIAIFVVILSINNFGPMQAMQRSLTDLLCQITSSDEARPNVLLVRVDGKSQNEYGAWPWDHDLIADLTAAVASGEPKAILLDFELPEDAAQDSAGHTDVLARQLIWIDQAVLSYDIALATFRSNKTSNPEYLFPNFIQTNSLIGTMDEQSSLVARKVFLPAEKILAHKPYLGFNYSRPDGDRILRHQPMAMYYEGYYYPSLSLATAAVALGVPFDQIKVFEGEEIQIGSERTVPINSQGDFFINFGPGVPFKEYSASEILSSGFDFGKLKGQTVVIAVADIDANMLYATPTGPEVSVPVIDATVIENIVNSNFLTIWDDAPALQLLLLFILGGVCAFVLPRVNLMYRMIILGGGLILLINVTYLLFTSYQLVLEPMYLVLELVLFMIASPVLDSQFITGEKARPSAKASARPKPRSTKPEPLPELREIVASDTDPENVETQHVAEPASTSQPMAEASIDHQTITLDDDAPLPPVVPTPETPTRGLTDSDRTAINGLAAQDPVAQDAAITGNDVLFETPVPERPDTARDSQGIMLGSPDDIKNLGRYQVTGVLGKGAMGTVYKGIDPAINRPVALKTIRLDFVNDPEELQELKERLHREAQAAGKLSHPNIVTIYDVGSEGSLQYIAMEYLEGQTLEDLIKKKVRFNYRIIAQIITQICAALDYAHERGIVHRDIKPANIMVVSDYRVKVMDYGIARVDSNSMTKTGIAMGTPNYISPEQLRGQDIDRRADLFSLGVVMYEMLLGRRPFKGENLTALMYSILNNEPEKPSNVKPQVPLLFDHIISKALQKECANRYQKASEVAADLADFVESFATK